MAEDVSVVEFRLGAERYCLDIESVAEVVDAEVTPLPNTPPRVVGVQDLRGDTVRILDPRAAFDVDEGDAEADGSGRVVLLDSPGEPTGWLVDDVPDVHSVALDDMDRSFEGDGEGIRGLVRVDEEFVIWVDAGAV